MCGRGRGSRKKLMKNGREQDDGFGKWGGYMAAKRAKLLDQFHNEEIKKLSDIFAGIKILVNGLTHPSADELKNLMAAHGGEFHMYQVSSTTHIIASNLPNAKIKFLGTVPIVKPAWITDSISLNKLLDYKRYLLYSNQSKSQPALNFPLISKPSALESTGSNFDENKNLKEQGVIKRYNSGDIHEEQMNQKLVLDSENMVEKPTSHSNAQNTIEPKPSSTTSTNTRVTKTASDPRFLEEFYSNSRLHLISTLGAEFKLLVGQLREKSDGKFPGREKLIMEKGKVSSKAPVPSSIIMHIDMDCFFVSVSLRNHPELRGKPVAITHARNGVISNADPNRQANREKEFELYQERLPEGMPSRVVDIKDRIDGLASLSEIASCSYEARKCGIKNGMFMGQAVKLCPELKTLPYDFEGYKEVSSNLYKNVASYTLDIEAVSCDEMYVDVRQILIDTGLSVEEWATHIRHEIMTITGCPCSTGFGANRLQARLATKKAKPAGQYYLKPEDVEIYMSEIPVADLPGVGRATLVKLQSLGLNTCGDVQIASRKVLQSELGLKLGEKIQDQAFGKDNKPLDFNHERKSVSAEINYGIRFKTKEDCYNFLQSLSNEVFSRISEIGMRARCLTLKLLIRAAGAPVETAKFLGHGVCDSISKSSTSNLIFSNADIIYKEAKMIYDKLNIPYAELRGVGIQLTKLEKKAIVNKALSNFLKQGAAKKHTTDITQTARVKLKQNNDNITETTPKINVPGEETVAKISNVSDRVESKDISESIQQKNSSNITMETKKFKDLDITKCTNTKQAKGLRASIVTSKGKGRPRGGKTSGSKNNVSKPVSKKGNVLDNFLGKVKRNSGNDGAGISNAEVTRLRGQIDLDVLNELPEDIRKEIIKEYQITLNPEVDIRTESKNSPKINETLVRGKPETGETSKSMQETTKVSLFSNLSWEQIKPMLKAWIKSEREPCQVDVEMLGNYLRQLALDRKIEVLKYSFNFLHRVFSDLNCEWHQAYFSLINSAQQGMVARYGKTLLVENDFSCCQIH